MSRQDGVFVLGVALGPPAERHDGFRLDELIYNTTKSALDDAGVTRGQLDNVTIGACDELDGRPISTMPLAPAAGAYLTDEIRVTDSGASALCLAAARHMSGDFHLGVVASWCKPSKTDVASVMHARCEPFFTRDLGFDGSMADGLFAQAASAEFGITSDEVDDLVVSGYRRAADNPRGMGRAVPTTEQVAASSYESTPVRVAHRAPSTDGAACIVLASSRWMDDNPGHRPIAQVAGVGWATDSYRLDRERLCGLGSMRTAWQSAMRMAGGSAVGVGAVELECPTAFHEAVYARAMKLQPETLCPSGGVYAQNPLTAMGLVNAVEAILQVSGRAGAVQRVGVERAVAHSCHGFAQQGNVVMVFDNPGSSHDA